MPHMDDKTLDRALGVFTVAMQRTGTTRTALATTLEALQDELRPQRGDSNNLITDEIVDTAEEVYYAAGTRSAGVGGRDSMRRALEAVAPEIAVTELLRLRKIEAAAREAVDRLNVSDDPHPVVAATEPIRSLLALRALLLED